MNTNDFNGITELSELTEFFMKEKAGNGIAQTIAFPNGVWERVNLNLFRQFR